MRRALPLLLLLVAFTGCGERTPRDRAVACTEDMACWLPALDGNGRGRISIDAPAVPRALPFPHEQEG